MAQSEPRLIGTVRAGSVFTTWPGGWMITHKDHPPLVFNPATFSLEELKMPAGMQPVEVTVGTPQLIK